MTSDSTTGGILWYTRCPLPTASGIALDAGILERSLASIGLAARSIESARDPEARHSHFTHSVRHLFRQGGNIPPIWARSRGADTSLVGIAWTPEYQAVLARPELGIHDAASLRGRRLALPVRTGGEIDFWQAMCLRGYQSALSTAGLTLADVELVRLPVDERYIESGDPARPDQAWMWAGAARCRRQTAETFAYIRGEVDAIYTSGALGVQLQAMLGATVACDLGLHPDPAIQVNNQVPNILTVDRRLAQDQPEVVALYLSALNEAAQWAPAHADAARRTFAAEVGAPEEWIAAAYGEHGANSLAVGLDTRLIDAVDSQKRFLLDHGFIASDFSIHEWINPLPLQLSQSSRSRKSKEHR